MKSQQTIVYSKVKYLKKRIEITNQDYLNQDIDIDILKQKLKKYNKQIKQFEREYILLPNLHIEILMMKKIINQELKELNEFIKKDIYLNWETGEITLK